jgi:actin-related protein 5
MVFRPQISKNRDASKADLPIKGFVNTSYEQLELTRNNYKSPYERNLVLHFSLLEQCNDYLLGELVRPNRRLRSPLIISEPFANPQHCRNAFLEQFFECYEIDSVMVGVDALFAYFYEVDCNMARYESETALVISMGATAIHVVAVVGGVVDFSSVRRLNLGGNNAFELFGRSLLLKNLQLKDKLTYGFLRDIYERFTSVAVDYRQQLRYFESKFKPKPDAVIYRNRVEEANKAIQEELSFIEGLEIDFDTLIEMPE